jgi:peptide/nickel transport system substrate-binding protein
VPGPGPDGATRALSRRSAIRLIVCGTGGVVAAACAPAAVAPQLATVTPAPAATVAAAPAPATTPVKPGGTLRIGMVGDIITLDGILWQPNNSATVGMVYDVLVTYDDALQPQPRLAESWELSPDLSRIKLNLRRGVRFHSGREFTSDDVTYNLLRARAPNNPFAAAVAVGSAWWTRIDTPDKYTVVLTSDRPRPGVFDFLLYLRILDKETMDGPDAKTKAIGTGPFRWVEWVPGDHIVLAKNPGYWDSPRPYLDQATVRIMADQQAMVAALEGGAIDVAFLAPISDAARLQADPRYAVSVRHDVGQYFYATANATVPPTDNKQVRQAINYAIDRQRFADTVLKGIAGPPQDLPWAPTSPAWDDAKNNQYTFDLGRARALLAAAGVANLEFDISYALAGYSAEYASLATILQADLASIGVKTNLKPQDNAVFTAAGNGLRPTYNGVRLSAGAFANLAEATSELTLSRTFGHRSNLAGFYDDRYAALVEAASTEPDAAKRKALYGQINDFILDASYSMSICPYPDILITRPNVHGLQYATSLELTLRNTWLG